MKITLEIEIDSNGSVVWDEKAHKIASALVLGADKRLREEGFILFKTRLVVEN